MILALVLFTFPVLLDRSLISRHGPSALEIYIKRTKEVTRVSMITVRDRKAHNPSTLSLWGKG